MKSAYYNTDPELGRRLQELLELRREFERFQELYDPLGPAPDDPRLEEVCQRLEVLERDLNERLGEAEGAHITKTVIVGHPARRAYLRGHEDSSPEPD